VEVYPEGYPQLASFLNSSDNFAILRRFGRTNCRVLLHLQAEIQALEKELDDLDQSDARDATHEHRLVSTEHKEGWDTKQQEILKALQEKLAIFCTENPQP
jgi:Skp family chaperone for outer membrane proteins